jgi:hypothetical protein
VIIALWGEAGYTKSVTIFLQEAIMTEQEFEVYMNREITQKEIDERLADIRRIHAEISKAEQEDPLPDDFIDYCKGRKFRQVPFTLAFSKIWAILARRRWGAACHRGNGFSPT